MTLERIAAALSSSEDKATLNALVATLNAHNELTIEQLAAALGRASPRTKKAAKPPAAKKSKAQPIDEELVSNYVAALEAGATDAAAVRKIVGEIKTDKRAKAAEIGRVLSQIRGSEVKVSRKPDGLKEIEQWYQRRRDTARRISDASGIY